jgi:hypothetical protein
LVRASSIESLRSWREEITEQGILNFDDLNAEENTNEANQILLGLRTPEFIEDRKKYTFYPSDQIMVCWEIFVSLILMLTVFLTPLNFAFQKEFGKNVSY